MQTKICNICKKEIDVSLFEHWRRQCKQCRNAYKRSYCKWYYEKNSIKLKQRSKQYYETNKQSIKIKSHEYYEKNKEDIYNKRKKYLLDNPDKKIEYANKKKISWKKRYDKNRDSILEKNKIYSKIRKYKNKNKVNVHKKISAYIIKHWIKINNKCSKCWFVWDVERHHIDYNKRNEIVILCNSCHSKANIWSIWYTNDDLRQFIIDVKSLI